MEILHHGFDGLDLTIDTQITEQLSLYLEKAKQIATELNQPWTIDVRDTPLAVYPHGVRGGYAFLCDTGAAGVSLMLKKHDAKGGWGVRISFKSLALATRGLKTARQEVEALCRQLFIPISGCSVSLSRVDFAVDLISQDFELSQGQFIIHPRMRRKSFADIDTQSSIRSASHDHSITVGKMPNRQVIIYDKTRDVRDKRKVEWPEIWNTHLRRSGKPALDFEDATNRVWRIELRAGKKYLKDQWNIAGWDSLFRALPHLLDDLSSSIRFAAPMQDTNRARWPVHPAWALLGQVIPEAIFDAVPEFDKEKIVELMRDEKKQSLERQLLGLSVSHAAILGISETTFDAYLHRLPRRLQMLSNGHPKPLQERLTEAAMRHSF